jgi:hypothetical protein
MAFQWNSESLTTANETKVDNDFSQPLPPDQYDVIVNSVQDKTTKAGGGMLAIELEVINGPYAKRRIWDNINYNCPTNRDAEAMAYRTLGDISRAIYGTVNQGDPTAIFTGKILTVRTKHGKEFNGKIPTAVSKYMPSAVKSAAKPAATTKPTEDRDADVPF